MPPQKYWASMFGLRGTVAKMEPSGSPERRMFACLLTSAPYMTDESQEDQLRILRRKINANTALIVLFTAVVIVKWLLRG